jgi:hypothetical protein
MMSGTAKIQDLIQCFIAKLQNQHINLDNHSIFIFNLHVNEIMLNPGYTIYEIISKPNALSDGWLDLTYHNQETF